MELARYRNEAMLSLTKASDQSGISRARLGHLETGRQRQDSDDIARLLRTYRAKHSDIDRLMSLTNRADEATWWAPWAQVVPDWLTTFVGLEGLAQAEQQPSRRGAGPVHLRGDERLDGRRRSW